MLNYQRVVDVQKKTQLMQPLHDEKCMEPVREICTEVT
jgi:hypothetical protein